MSLIGLGVGYLLIQDYKERKLLKKFELKYTGNNKEEVWKRYKSRYNSTCIDKVINKVKDNYKTRQKFFSDLDYEVIDDIDMDDIYEQGKNYWKSKD